MSLLQTFKESFAPLRIRNFRVYLSGQIISLLGTWMQITAQGWVVWDLSRSTEALGIVAMLGALPLFVLGPFAGAWADRFDRRKLLIALQFMAMLLAFILAFLVQTGAVQLWHVYVLSVLLGIIAAVDLPAQQAFLGDLSGMTLVRKAVVVNAMALQVSRTLGPALAGFVISALGVARAFWLNGISFLAVIASLLMVRSAQLRRADHSGGRSTFRDGLRFVGQQPRIQDLLVFTGLVTFFGLSVLNIFPAVAADVLKGEADVLGLLMGSSGAGALFSALFVVPIAQSLRRTGLMLFGAVIWMGVWVIMLSFTTILPLAMLSTFLFSIAAPVVITTALGMVQILSPSHMRARLQGILFMVSFGLQPFASLMVGYSASHFGTPAAIQLNGLLLIVCGVLLLASRADLRVWEVAARPAASGNELGAAD